MAKIGLTRDQLVLITKHRQCEVGHTIIIGKQKFQMCLSGSNSVYMSETTPRSAPQLAA